jgi:hypothetical protein
VLIDGSLVLDNNSPNKQGQTKSTTLTAGQHAVAITFLKNNARNDLYHWMTEPGSADIMPINGNSCLEGQQVSVRPATTTVCGHAGIRSVFPNPFSNTVTVEFVLPSGLTGRDPVDIRLYNLGGRMVKSANVRTGEARTDRIVLDMSVGTTRALGAGMYLCRFRAGSSSWTKTVTCTGGR